MDGGEPLNAANLPIIILWLILYLSLRKRQKAVALRKIIRKRKLEGNTEMKELAQKFVGRECIVYSFDGNHQYAGIIQEVTDGAILLENEGNLQAINLDFVIRIREYPRNKNGKKKSVIMD